MRELDKGVLKEFVEEVLPPLEGDEVFIVYMMGRKKYWGELNKSSVPLDIFVMRSNDWRELKEIASRLFCEECYSWKGQAVPLTARACYIDLTPKSVAKGLVKFYNEFLWDLYSLHNASEKDREVKLRKMRNSVRHLLGYIHRTNSRKISYLVIDIDTKGVEERLSVEDFIPRDAVKWITETRGGFHIILERKHLPKDFWVEVLPQLKKLDFIDVETKQAQTVVPGTLQGGFLTRRVSWDDVFL